MRIFLIIFLMLSCLPQHKQNPKSKLKDENLIGNSIYTPINRRMETPDGSLSFQIIHERKDVGSMETFREVAKKAIFFNVPESLKPYINKQEYEENEIVSESGHHFAYQTDKFLDNIVFSADHEYSFDPGTNWHPRGPLYYKLCKGLVDDKGACCKRTSSDLSCQRPLKPDEFSFDLIPKCDENPPAHPCKTYEIDGRFFCLEGTWKCIDEYFNMVNYVPLKLKEGEECNIAEANIGGTYGEPLWVCDKGLECSKTNSPRFCAKPSVDSTEDYLNLLLSKNDFDMLKAPDEVTKTNLVKYTHFINRDAEGEIPSIYFQNTVKFPGHGDFLGKYQKMTFEQYTRAIGQKEFDINSEPITRRIIAGDLWLSNKPKTDSVLFVAYYTFRENGRIHFDDLKYIYEVISKTVPFAQDRVYLIIDKSYYFSPVKTKLEELGINVTIADRIVQ